MSSPSSSPPVRVDGPVDPYVCIDEGIKWRECTRSHVSQPARIRRYCDPFADAYDQCAAAWRARVGGGVRLKGDNPGEPPHACNGMSCVIGECLRSNEYRFEDCTVPTEYFKRCVKGLYGSEYIED